MGSRGHLGILLTNIGSPDAPTPRAVRRYLREFLSDPRVIELSRPLWWPILYGLILPFRPRRSARAYKEIWTEQGSPLVTVTACLAKALEANLATRLNGSVTVALGMRYGSPSIVDALAYLERLAVSRLLLLPLYPQYCSATTGSSFEKVSRVLSRQRGLPELRTIGSYHDEEAYLHALAQRIAAAWEKDGRPQRLLFSFHGIPEDYHRRGDPYFGQCQETASNVAHMLGLSRAQWLVAFQSRVGPRAWLKPYTDQALLELARCGVQHVDVVCPGFSVDCLETLEEVDLRYRRAFLEAGGRRFGYIPALNDTLEHVEALAGLVLRQIRGWPEANEA